MPGFAVPLFALAERISYRLAHRLVAVTNGLKKYLIQEYQIPASKISVISNGVNVERFSPAPSHKSDNHYLGFVGNLVHWAGLEDLIRSIPLVVSEIQNVRYLIVGDGQLRESLEQLTKSLQVNEFVEFTGKVVPEAVPSYINQCEICFVPAIIERNADIGVSPIKLYEYLACGTPVIVTDIEGLDMVKEYHVGMVAEPENPQSLAEATLKLLRNPEKRKRMAISARRVVVKHFSWKNIAEKVKELCYE
ncbi:MAG: glycosyltransferase [Aliifodinibius sp.]|nr:glycosyltransferase family 4 protein [Fodinibius sp.]NIV16607.1 glycosyltransferase [Fodinibius sp.]NIY30588.1 glycosyltransferase [Fodinibius sp.]